MWKRRNNNVLTGVTLTTLTNVYPHTKTCTHQEYRELFEAKSDNACCVQFRTTLKWITDLLRANTPKCCFTRIIPVSCLSWWHFNTYNVVSSFVTFCVLWTFWINRLYMKMAVVLFLHMQRKLLNTQKEITIIIISNVRRGNQSLKFITNYYCVLTLLQ